MPMSYTVIEFLGTLENMRTALGTLLTTTRSVWSIRTDSYLIFSAAPDVYGR